MQKFRVYILVILVVAVGLFVADFTSNGYASKLGMAWLNQQQASLLSVEMGQLEDTENSETEVAVADNGSNTVAEEGQDEGIVKISINQDDLVEKDVITEEVLFQAGLLSGRLEDLQYTNLLYEVFPIKELTDYPLTKQAVYDGDKIIAFIYKFPSESYALGLKYAGVKEQVLPNVGGGYELKEPSAFGPNSFYMINPNKPTVTALAQLDNTLLGFEYDKADYQTVKKIVDVVLENSVK